MRFQYQSRNGCGFTADVSATPPSPRATPIRPLPPDLPMISEEGKAGGMKLQRGRIQPCECFLQQRSSVLKRWKDKKLFNVVPGKL